MDRQADGYIDRWTGKRSECLNERTNERMNDSTQSRPNQAKSKPRSSQTQAEIKQNPTEIKPNPKSQPHQSQRASQAKPSQPSQPWHESPEAGSSSARLGSAPPLLHLRPRTHRPGPPVAPIGRGPCRGSPVGREKCYKTMTSQKNLGIHRN